MATHLHDFLVFARYVHRYIRYIRGILLGLLLLIGLCGVALSRLENLPLVDAIYFSLVTGLTIGYGDIVPVTLGGRVVSLAVGLIGVVYTGLFVAIAVRALADMHEYLDQRPRPESVVDRE